VVWFLRVKLKEREKQKASAAQERGKKEARHQPKPTAPFQAQATHGGDADAADGRVVLMVQVVAVVAVVVVVPLLLAALAVGLVLVVVLVVLVAGLAAFVVVAVAAAFAAVAVVAAVVQKVGVLQQQLVEAERVDAQDAVEVDLGVLALDDVGCRVHGLLWLVGGGGEGGVMYWGRACNVCACQCVSHRGDEPSSTQKKNTYVQ
jgi:hypothetical protein